MKLVKEIDENIFREYDIRGIVDSQINIDTAYTIGRSFASYIKKNNEKKTIVGHDNRLSSEALNNALIKGLTDSGCDVIDLGLVTTPMYYFARKHYKINTGIMITASHNPKEYNGFKIAFSSLGNAYGKMITDFKEFTKKLNFETGLGKIEHKNIKEEYIKLLCNSIKLNKKIKVVVDCGNGTGSIIIKDILDKLNIEYYLLYSKSDGNFPNHHPDPSIKENMIDLSLKVKELGYDLGIGIDGDADRVGITDEHGNILAADLYMIIMYRYLKGKIKNKALYDVKCSRSLIDELKKLNYEMTMYKTGNSIMNMKMHDGFDFGGEYSGHMWFNDKFMGFDDGIYSALRMIEVLSNSDKTVSEWLENINKYFSTDEIKIPVDDNIKDKIVNKIKDYCKDKKYEFIDIDGVRVEFEDSWALIRKSNTSPNLTVRFEANNLKKLEKLKQEFIELINKML